MKLIPGDMFLLNMGTKGHNGSAPHRGSYDNISVVGNGDENHDKYKNGDNIS